MKRTPLSIPEIAIIAGTRGALGAGLGLLLADRLDDSQRRAVGWTLFAVGAISTIPIAVQLMKTMRDENEGDGEMSSGRMAQREYASCPPRQ